MVSSFKRNCICIAFLLIPFYSFLYSQFDFQVDIKPINITDFPAIHSFSYGVSDEHVIMIGGRNDGIHPKENGFERTQANESAFVWNTNTQQIKSYDLSNLSNTYRDALHSANAAFVQWGNFLVIAGGYGESVDGSFKTFPHLSIINLPLFNNLLSQGLSPDKSIQIFTNDTFALAGAEMRMLHDTFFLVGGHRLDGKYHSSSSKINQRYSNSARIFTIDTSNADFSVKVIKEIVDEFNFHRRDYNLKPFITPSGIEKLMIYSGVFQYNVDRPFHNIALIDYDGFIDIENFAHRFAAYRCSNIAFYSKVKKSMSNLFIGGMAEFYPDDLGEIIQDSKVPFVKTISGVTADSNGNFKEWFLPARLPSFIGTNAEIYLNPKLIMIGNEVVSIDDLYSIKDTIFLGYMFGGIENSTSENNPWDKNRALETNAMKYVLKIQLIPRLVNTKQNPNTNYKEKIHLTLKQISYNKLLVQSITDNKLEIESYWLVDPQGKIIAQENWSNYKSPPFTITTQLQLSGSYILYFQNKDKSLHTIKWLNTGN